MQWWYGHNAVGFFLTTPFLGMMYYFVPKQAGAAGLLLPALDRPLLGAGLHLHLGRPASPALHGAARLGADARHGVLLMLLAPSWGGMINGLLTLSRRLAQAAHRSDPQVLSWRCRFYGMATFEGPLLSIKTVNALSHYTDWTIGHVHTGALGLGGHDDLRLRVLADPAALRQDTRCAALGSSTALLDRDHRHRALRRRDVDRGRDAGPHVARDEPDGTLTYTFVEALKADVSVLPVRLAGRAAVPRRHVHHGLQHVRRPCRRQTGHDACPVPRPG